MSEVLKGRSRIDRWLAAADVHPDWEAIFEGYCACAETPSCA